VFKRLVSLAAASAVLIASFSAAAQEERVLVIGWEQEPDILEPLSNSTFSGLLNDFYSRYAWDWDTDYDVYPILVEEIPTVENGLVTADDAGNTVVTYNLREGALWSDGEPITSEDFLLGHRIYSDVSTGTIARGLYPEAVASVEAVDDFTLVQTFNGPYPDYISDQVYVRAYPAHVW
jgi:ABC-type transport system substrate-binding protein